MRQLLLRLLLPLRLLRPQKMEMRDRRVSRGHEDEVVAVVVEETNRLRMLRLLMLQRLRNRRLRRNRRLVQQEVRLDQPDSVSLAPKHSILFVARLNHW
jgi:hypothetical protein